LFLNIQIVKYVFLTLNLNKKDEASPSQGASTTHIHTYEYVCTDKVLFEGFRIKSHLFELDNRVSTLKTHSIDLHHFIWCAKEKF